MTPTRVMQKYDNLLEQHVIARRKYFEMYGRASGKQLSKLEKNFYDTLSDLRNYESKLEDWQKEVLQNKVDMYPQDTLITEKYQETSERVDFVGDFEDPHLLETQRSSNYAQDTEETEGSIEDYLKYKGLDS
jgi:GTPase involved in cell partitioning and DNA repair